MGSRVISFLSDYGLRDEFVGVCHGVLIRGCPQAQIIDLTHGIPRHDLLAGALTLRAALSYLPAGVHLAVVDPEVGSESRRAVAIETQTDARFLVGPDNGLLWLALEQLGGPREVIDIGRSPVRLEPVSATFHGRDIFAPVAAALAAGAPLSSLGEPLDPDQLVKLELPSAQHEGDSLRMVVLTSDRFGNLILSADHRQLAALGLRLGQTAQVKIAGDIHSARFARSFADVGAGELLLYEDGQQMAALAVNRGSAAEKLSVAVGAQVVVSTA